MFEQAFKNIDNVLRKEVGCTTELDYTEQTSWLLPESEGQPGASNPSTSASSPRSKH